MGLLQPGAATMTVVFTDLVGSTAMRSELGDDRADELRREHDELLARLVDEHRGVVVKGTGDGVMAVFHAPSEAISAVTAIQHAISRRNRRAEVPLSLRIGVSIGEVRIEGEDVFGTPVVESARLCAKAADDQILASVFVKALVGSRTPVGWSEIGLLELKGLSDELLTYEVRWWEAGSARPLPFPVIPALTEPYPFVGRDLERFALVEPWSRAQEGRGPVVFIGGEPGVGKTRLAAQFARAVHQDGATVLHGRCKENISPPYEPFVGALRTYLAHLSDTQLGESLGPAPDELIRLVPELAGRVSRPARADVSPGTRSLRLFDAVAGWLVAASRAEPIVFLVDDLQWAGASTIAMLRHVLLTTDAMRVLVVGTYREEDVPDSHPLAVAVTELRQSTRGVEQIHLSGLGAAEVRLLLEHAIGSEEVPEDVVLSVSGALQDPTDGNPLHVDQALRYLREIGQLVDVDGVPRLAVEDEAAAVPTSIAGTVAERLPFLDEVTASTLRVASVLGQEFELSVLQALLGIDDTTLRDAVELAIEGGFLTELPVQSALGFSHSLVRESIHDTTLIKWRVAVHRRVADEIERRAAGKDPYLLPLAYHYIEAAADGDATKGIDYAVSAARRLSEDLAFADARRWYRTALRLLERGKHSDDARRLDLLVAQGQTESLAGRSSARQTLTRAADLAVRLGDSAALIQAVLAVRPEPMFAPPDDGHVFLRTIRQALEVVGSSNAGARARLLAMAAFEMSHFPIQPSSARSPVTARVLPPDPIVVANQALEAARTSSDRGVLLDVLQLRVPTIDGPDSLAERAELSDELDELAEQLDEPFVRFRAAIFRAQCCLEMGATDAVDEWIDVGRGLLRKLHLPVPTYAMAEVEALRALLVGELDDAERAAEHRRKLAEVVGQRDRPEHVAYLYALRLQQGRGTETNDLAEQLAQQPAEWLGYTGMYALAEAGRVAEAGVRYQEAADRGTDALGRLPRLRGVAASNLALLAALFGDESGAELWYSALEAHARELPRGATMLHCGAHHLGMLAAVLGRPDEAHRWWELAVSVHENASAPLLAAETRLEWARYCAATGDGVRARDLAEQARGTAVRLRAGGIEGRARHLIDAMTRGRRDTDFLAIPRPGQQ